MFCSVCWRRWRYGGAGGDAPCFALYAGGVGGTEVLEAMRRILLCMLAAVEGRLCLLEVSEVPEAMRGVLLCMSEVVECRLCLLEALEVRRCWR